MPADPFTRLPCVDTLNYASKLTLHGIEGDTVQIGRGIGQAIRKRIVMLHPSRSSPVHNEPFPDRPTCNRMPVPSSIGQK